MTGPGQFTYTPTYAARHKLEMLAGLFGIGQQPTGDRDPYGLRRQALQQVPHFFGTIVNGDDYRKLRMLHKRKIRTLSVDEPEQRQLFQDQTLAGK